MIGEILKYLKELDEKLVYGEDVTQEEVDAFLGMSALLYATANIDSIVKSEQQVINLYKFNMSRALDRLRHKNLRDIFYEHLGKLEEIEAKKDSIKLSQALNYFPQSFDTLSENMKSIIKKLSTDVIEADQKISEEEKSIRKCIELYVEKGVSAIGHIESLEKNCY